MIKPISISGGVPTNAPPLLFVIFVSMLKDWFEDRVRQKSDAEENNKFALKLDGSEWVAVRWRDVQIGDILKVLENE
jgi:phospholipid-transporting ATPase